MKAPKQVIKQVGTSGQISLGTGAFMAVGAYAAYNFHVRTEGMPLLATLLLGGVCATAVGVGRAYLYGLMAGGEAGVQRVADLLAEGIASTMALLGRTSIAALGPDCLRLRD